MAHEASPSVERLLSESVWLASLARALLGDDEAAVDDVVQEARLAALQSAPADPDHARAWLARVTRNFALRVRLRRTRRERRERAAAVPEAQPSTVELVARVNAQRRVAAAVVALDEPYRSVVLLRWFDARSVRDVAARLGVPVETVRTRLKRALAKLRDELDAGFGSRDAWAALLLPWTAPIERAATSGAAAAKAAGTAKAGAGGAAVVGAGVVAMSFATKTGIAVACVVAGVAAWRMLPQRAALESAKSGSNSASSSDLAAARGADASASDSSRRAESADATRSADPTTAADSTANAAPAAKVVRISGTIVSSLDDRPVANAELRISTIRWDPSKVVETVLASVRADADGHVMAVVPTEAQLHPMCEVFADGYVPDVLGNFDASPTAHDVHDLGSIRLARGVGVSGRVVMPDGSPVAGAELRIERYSPTGSLETLDISRAAATSAADGSFRLRDRIAPPSRDLVPLFALCDEGLGIGTIRVPAAADEGGAVDVVVGAPARLTVVVRDEAGAPVEGARVCCMPRFVPFSSPQMRDGLTEFLTLREPRLATIFDGTSDASGVATFTKLPMAPAAPVLEWQDLRATRYAVAARADGLEPGNVDDVRVDPAAPATCTVVLRRPRFVSLVGKVKAPDGEPIPDAEIDAWADASPVHATSDEHGEFRVDRLATTWKKVQLQVAAPGRAKFDQGFAFADLPSVPLQDEHGALLDARSVDVVLEKTARVSGRVVDESGAPVAGARMSYSRGLRGMHLPGPVDIETPGTDAQGRFDHEVSESEWIVIAWAPLGEGKFGPSVTRSVTGGAKDLLLTCPTQPRRAAKVTCEVVDATSGASLPIESASVDPAEGFRGNWNVWKTVTLGKVVASSLFAGRWRIDVVLLDHRRASREFEVASDRDEVQLRIEIGAPARVVGRVEVSAKDAAALPKWARLGWHPSDARLVDSRGRVLSAMDPPQVDLSGDRTFILDGFVPGQTVRVRFTDFDTIFDEVVFTPTNSEVREIVLRPQPAAHVVWKSSLDVSKGWLVVDLAFGDEPWRSEFFLLHPESDAKEPVHTLRPGHYRWRAFFQLDTEDDEAPRVTTATGEFDVAAGATHELRIDELR